MNAVALREPKSTAWVDGVVQSAAIAPWQRVLQALDSLARAPGEAVQALGFVVGRRSGGVYLKLIADDPESPGKGNELDAEDALAFAQLPSERAALAALEQHRHDVYDGDAIGPALAQLAGHPRVYLQVRGKRRSLQVRRGDVALAARPNPDGTVTLSLTAGGRDLGDAELEDVRSQRARRTSVAIDEAAGICTVVDTDPRLARVWATIERHGAVLPAEAASALLARLPALSESVPVDVSPELLGREVPAEPRFVLRLAPWEQDGVEAWVGVRALPGAPVHPVGSGPGIVHAHEPGVPLAERRYARRDLADERTLATERLAPLALAPIAEGAPMSWRIAGDAALELLEALRGLAGAVDVEWPDGQTRRVHAAGTGALSYRVTEGRDWFGLEGEIEIDGDRVALAALLEALRGGRRYVRVGAHDWLRISDELRARLGLVAQVAQPTRHGLELPALAAPALAETLAGAVQPVRWQKLIARAHAAESFTPEVPAGLGVTLRDYQVHGYEWLMRLCEWAPGGCLADDMGLGKTIQALALLAARADRGPALVVAPTSVCFNWVREAERVAPMLRVRMGRESDVAPTELGPGDLYIVSYGIMVKDLESLKQQRFATLIVDEAQALKNPASQRARAAIELDAEFRLALTGTPLENRLADLWSLCRTTAPGLLGSWDRFRERFAVPIERHADDERRAALARLVRPFLLRRVKREVAPELPPRAEVRVDVVLSTGEREVYDAERLSAAQRLAGVGGDSGFDARFEVLAALTRLRQLVCHPKLHNPESTLPSSKLERLVELVNELRAEGHRTLVFSQFTGLLAHVKTAFDAEGISYLYLDGRTPAGKRRELVDAFQAGTGDAFLISLKAGGTGLNLTGADNVIHLDPWWNPAVEDQASDRAHRIGQTRPVTIYKLVAQDTIEDKILSMQEDKRALVAGVLDGAGAVSTTSTADLLALLADEASITPTNHSSSGAAGPSPSRPASATPRRPRPSSRPPR